MLHILQDSLNAKLLPIYIIELEIRQQLRVYQVESYTFNPSSKLRVISDTCGKPDREFAKHFLVP